MQVPQHSKFYMQENPSNPTSFICLPYLSSLYLNVLGENQLKLLMLTVVIQAIGCMRWGCRRGYN